MIKGKVRSYEGFMYLPLVSEVCRLVDRDGCFVRIVVKRECVRTDLISIMEYQLSMLKRCYRIKTAVYEMYC